MQNFYSISLGTSSMPSHTRHDNSHERMLQQHAEFVRNAQIRQRLQKMQNEINSVQQKPAPQPSQVPSTTPIFQQTAAPISSQNPTILEDSKEIPIANNGSNSTVQAITSQFITDLMNQENPNETGLKGDIFYPYASAEGGNPTIGYGHRLTNEEVASGTFNNGIRKAEAKKLLQTELTIAYKEAERIYNKMKSPDEKPFNECSITAKQVATDLVFNTGTENFKVYKKFRTAMAKNDVDVMKIESKSKYKDANGVYHEMKKRNAFRAEVLDRENTFHATKRTGTEAGLTDNSTSRRPNLETDTVQQNIAHSQQSAEPRTNNQPPEEIKISDNHMEDIKQTTSNDDTFNRPTQIPSTLSHNAQNIHASNENTKQANPHQSQPNNSFSVSVNLPQLHSNSNAPIEDTKQVNASPTPTNIPNSSQNISNQQAPNVSVPIEDIKQNPTTQTQTNITNTQPSTTPQPNSNPPQNANSNYHHISSHQARSPITTIQNDRQDSNNPNMQQYKCSFNNIGGMTKNQERKAVSFIATTTQYQALLNNDVAQAVVEAGGGIQGLAKSYAGVTGSVPLGQLAKVAAKQGALSSLKHAAIAQGVITTYQIGSDAYNYYQGNISGKQFAKNTVVNVSSAAGGIGGGAAGGAAGAAIGTLLFPGIGTTIGWAIGTIFGGIFGNRCGHAAGNYLVN